MAALQNHFRWRLLVARVQSAVLDMAGTCCCVRQCSSTVSFPKRWKHITKCQNNNYILDERQRRWYTKYANVWYFGVAFAAAILCYANSVRGEFVHDDILAIVQNSDVREKTPISELFRNDFWGKSMSDNSSHKSYRPLCVLTFRLNHAVSGLQPLSYHIVNVCLHAVVTVTFGLICKQTMFSLRYAQFAAVLFAVHPIHTEAVSGIVGRADILCCLFFLATFYTYVRSIHGKSVPHAITMFVLSLILAMAAMLSKEQGVTVLAVCLVYDVIIHLNERNPWSWANLKKSVFLIRCFSVCLTVTLLLGFRIWLMNGQLPAFSDQDNPASYSPYLLTRLLTYSYLYAFNVWLLLAPVHLSYDWQMHSIPLIQTLADVRNIATAGFFLLMAALVYGCATPRPNQKRLVLGLVFLVFPFLPAANIFFRVGFVVAERILYIPSMGYIILFLHGFERVWLKMPRRKSFMTAILICLISLFVLRTVKRNQVWSSRETLFRSGLQTLPHNAKMHYNYANLMKDLGNHQQAKVHYRQTIRLWPTHASAHNNIGTLLNTSAQEAEQHFRMALLINPRHANAYFNLANLLNTQGDKMAGIKYLKMAVTYDPTSTAAHTNLAFLLAEMSQSAEALLHYEKVVELDPYGAQGFDNLFTFHKNTGTLRDGVDFMRRVYTSDPSNHLALRTAGRMYNSLGNMEQAQQLYSRAAAISRDKVTLNEVGIFYFNTRMNTLAHQLLAEAVKRFPADGASLCNYGHVLAFDGQLDEAETLLKQFLITIPGDTQVRRQLAKIYGRMNRHKQAITLLEDVMNELVNPADIAVIFSDIAKHYKDLGQLDIALQNYKKAVQYDSTLVDAQHNLGVIYHLKADAHMALHHYEAAKLLDPTNQLLLDNMQKLERAQTSWHLTDTHL